MLGGLPPSAPVPDLMQLLAPDEQLIYAPHLHWLNGWGYLAGAWVSGMVALYLGWYWLLLVGAGLVFAYSVPFRTNQIAITSHRLLLRVGRWRLRLNDISPGHINHYQFSQTPFTNIVGSGELILHLNKGKDLVPVTLPYVQKPMVFLEALGTLNGSLRGQIRS